ncbi:hypothetical protein [Jiella sp. M17.18]|uniref:hypothetical protein n=1 Tax=Jiella sp. M17.18 TaxID=3234247 RepID=UPI0034DEE9A0
MQYDESRGDKVSSIELKFDFLITPNSVSADRTGFQELDRPQSYTVSIVCNSFVLLKDDKIAAHGIGGVFRGNDQAPPINIILEYVDYVVARTLQMTIEEWIASLEKVDVWRIKNPAFSGRYMATESLKSLWPAAIIHGYIAYSSSGNEIITLRNASLFLISFFVLKYISDYIVEIADDMLLTYHNFPFVVLNKADRGNLAKFKRVRNRATTIGSAIAVGILTSIIGSVVYGYMV